MNFHVQILHMIQGSTQIQGSTHDKAIDFEKYDDENTPNYRQICHTQLSLVSTL